MPDCLFSEPKYKEWLESATFDNCLLKRKEFGQFLANYLVGEKEGFVLNLNGAWGTGKTEFCKRLYSDLISKNHPCVYIDAWESDFSKEPLTVVASELLKQMEELHSDVVGLEQTKEIKKVLGKTLKGLFVGLAGGVTKKLFDDSSTGIAAAQQIVGVEVAPEAFIDQLATDYTEQVESIKFIRQTLSDLADALESEVGTQLPVVVIVDELDRCRPDYAIEMLEVIKHFFTTKNFVFVIASDTQQLCESIKNIYGNEFDSNQYLKRFFDRTATLPEPNNHDYINAIDFEFTETTDLNLYPRVSESERIFIVKNISAFSDGFDLKIRDIDQLLNKVLSCLRTAKAYQDTQEISQAVNLPVLICGLIEYEKNLPSYYARTNNNESRPVLINQNVDYEEEIPLSLLINICFFSITKRVEEYDDRYRSITRTRYSIPVGSDFDPSNWEHEGTSASVRNLVSKVANVNSNSIDGRCKSWLWSDYKQVIELAGYLN
ncbi:P-loop NTPase fold protein [Vibrio splendidus]|uniref:KAP family P-loop NTPase fold protein n=1 Tax=Vibrio splendidus TaxID=29497 RepID=UPI00352DFB8D